MVILSLCSLHFELLQPTLIFLFYSILLFCLLTTCSLFITCYSTIIFYSFIALLLYFFLYPFPLNHYSTLSSFLRFLSVCFILLHLPVLLTFTPSFKNVVILHTYIIKVRIVFERAFASNYTSRRSSTTLIEAIEASITSAVYISRSAKASFELHTLGSQDDLNASRLSRHTFTVTLIAIFHSGLPQHSICSV